MLETIVRFSARQRRKRRLATAKLEFAERCLSCLCKTFEVARSVKPGLVPKAAAARGLAFNLVSASFRANTFPPFPADEGFSTADCCEHSACLVTSLLRCDIGSTWLLDQRRQLFRVKIVRGRSPSQIGRDRSKSDELLAVERFLSISLG
ncbi:unnamed protein product, partial [Effrenium voratum]